MKVLARRLSRVSDRVDPIPDAAFLAYARAVVAWAGSDPDEATALRLAQALARTRGGATWEGLVEMAGGTGGRTACYCPTSEHTTDRESGFH